MSYYGTLLVIIVSLAVITVALFWVVSWYKRKQKEQFLGQKLSLDDQKVLEKLPYYRLLSKTDQKAIASSINLFIHTKIFEGVGIEVTREMRIVTAFYACLLLLRREDLGCYENLTTIIFYPSAVRIDKKEEHSGVVVQEQVWIDGEAADDTLVLIWHDAKKEAYHLRKENVIIHEFAHEIDFMDGRADGMPPLLGSQYGAWSKLLYNVFHRLQTKVEHNREWGAYKLFGSYAASNEAEFFAVATERFFQKPQSFAKHFPKLYKQLRDFYKIDPLTLLQ